MNSLRLQGHADPITVLDLGLQAEQREALKIECEFVTPPPVQRHDRDREIEGAAGRTGRRTPPRPLRASARWRPRRPQEEPSTPARTSAACDGCWCPPTSRLASLLVPCRSGCDPVSGGRSRTGGSRRAADRGGAGSDRCVNWSPDSRAAVVDRNRRGEPRRVEATRQGPHASTARLRDATTPARWSTTPTTGMGVRPRRLDAHDRRPAGMERAERARRVPLQVAGVPRHARGFRSSHVQHGVRDRTGDGECGGPEHEPRVPYALLLASRNRDRVSVLDWGGGLGYYYFVARALLPDGVELDYHCKDMPVICEYGRQALPEITFWDDEQCLGRDYDLVLASSSLQFSEAWESDLTRLAHASVDYLFLTRVPIIVDHPSFVVLQRTHGYRFDTEYLSWVFNSTRCSRPQPMRASTSCASSSWDINRMSWARRKPTRRGRFSFADTRRPAPDPAHTNRAGRSRRWILPIEFRVKPSTKSQRSGTLYLARLARQCSRSSSLADGGAVAQLYRDRNPLPQPLVRDADDRARVDVGQLVQHALDLGGIHIAAAADDQQALAVADVQEAVVVDEPEVAGVQHSVAHRLGGGVVALPVAEHRPVHPGPLALGLGGDADLVVDDADREVRERAAAPTGYVAAVGPVDGDDRRRLAQPVGAEHRLGELGLERGPDRLGTVAAAAPHLGRAWPGHSGATASSPASEWTSAGGPFHAVTRSSRIHSGDAGGVDAVEDHRAPARLRGEQGGEHLHVEDGERQEVALAQRRAVTRGWRRAPRPGAAGCTGCAPRPWGSRSCRWCRRSRRVRTGRRRTRTARRARPPARRATRPAPSSSTTTRGAPVPVTCSDVARSQSSNDDPLSSSR